MKTEIHLSLLTIMTSMASTPARFLQNDFICEINRRQSKWIAGNNFAGNSTLERVKHLTGLLGLHPDPSHKPVTRNLLKFAGNIPEAFDARSAWFHCESTREIRDQGQCASCWAFASASCMTDRICIQSNGTTKFTFSTEDLMTCCPSCGYGCVGGYLLPAFEHWKDEGIVSGGEFNSNEGCRPYSADAAEFGNASLCQKTCRPDYGKLYEDDKKYGRSAYMVTASVKHIQFEIMTQGPIVAPFVVYQDFFSYKSGVYQHIIGNYAGLHSLKIIGWGNEAGVPYWLAANSWGPKWGDQGFVRIVKGQNESGIEDYIVAGNPLL